jgi:RimJ/RimL family protein N-acetyltransferase
MINAFLETNLIILEPLEEKHLTEEYISWLNDKDITKYNSHGIFPNTSKKTQEYINLAHSNSQLTFAIIEKKTLLHIGNASIYKIDFINSNADLSIIIGNKKFWGKGYGQEIFSILTQHCFNKLNLHKVTAGTTSDNIGMQKILENLNFNKEGIILESIRRDLQFFDTYLYGLINKSNIEQ